MLGKILLITPIIIFFILFFAFNYIGFLKKFNSKSKSFPLILTSMLIMIFFISLLTFFAIFDGYSIKSKYTPPYVENGKLIQGKFEE